MISINVEKGVAKEKQLISDLAYYCVKKLMPRKRNLEVDIIQVKNLEDKEGDLASCIDTDNLNTFEIKLDKDMSLLQLIDNYGEVKNIIPKIDIMTYLGKSKLMAEN